jgi:orotate phosphoribosyltransferase
VRDELFALMTARRGHFRLESGHHGDLWLDVDQMFRRPAQLRPFVAALARQFAAHEFDVVCGPLTGGAFVAQWIAEELDAEFVYAERLPRRDGEGLFPFEYRIPPSLEGIVRGKRVAVANDVINAGSAVRGALDDLRRLDARPTVLGATLVLGDSAAALAAAHDVPLESLVQAPNQIWLPAECPLCASGTPLEDIVE